MTNELVTNNGGNSLVSGLGGLRDAMMPKSFGEVLRFAEMVQHSSFVPKDFKGKPGEIVAVVTYGAEIGLSPMQALQSVACINGKPAIYGDAMLAVCQKHPLWEDMEERIEGDGDAMTAVCIVRRKGDAPARYSFSVSDARKADLWGRAGPWKQYPRRMLQMRARGFALRDQFADALKGLIGQYEAQDYPVGPDRARDVTPQAAHPIVDPADVIEDSGYDDETGEVLEAPRYKLGDDEFTADDWLWEADTRRRGLTNGDLEAFYNANRPVWQQILKDFPEKDTGVKALVGAIKAQAAAGKAQAEQSHTAPTQVELVS